MIRLKIIGISFLVIIYIVGCSSGDWNNPTGNTSDPRIISVIPPRGADGISPNENVVAFFSEDMDPSTINSGNFYLSPSAAGTVSYNATQKAAVFTPVGLSSDTNYIATVTTGVKDTSGRAMLTGYSWSFSTKSQSSGPTTMTIIPDSMDIGTTAGGSVDVQYIVSGGVTPYRVYFTIPTFVESPSDGSTVGSVFTVRFTWSAGVEATFQVVVTDSVGNSVSSDVTLAP